MIPIIFIRLLPWLMGVSGFFLASEQWAWTDGYPWLLVLQATLFIFSMAIMAWKRMKLIEFLEKMILPTLALVALGAAFLVFEQALAKQWLNLAIAFISFFSLELFFVSLYLPTKYPLYGLSRWNMALIPCIGFLAGSVLEGLQIFLNLPLWIVPTTFAGLGAIAYVVTSHPTASRPLRAKWLIVGAMVGMQIGILGLLIPVPMSAFGALSAICLAIPLRVRRYAYAPVPPRSLAWGEAVTMLGCVIMLLVGTRWT